jgi:hypothetical protein
VETLSRPTRPSSTARLRSAFTGADGNARLTATTGLVLLVLLPIEGLTLLSLHALLSVHMLVGVALIPPVALKLGSTFYRFLRYYTGSPSFRENGPPQLMMRVLVAPVLVASTIGLFASGVALLLLRNPNSFVYTIHKGSFIIWFGAIGIHVLVYLPHLPRLAVADWVRGKQEAVAGGYAGEPSRPRCSQAAGRPRSPCRLSQPGTASATTCRRAGPRSLRSGRS